MTTADMLSWVRQQIEARKALAETVRIGEGEWRYGHVGFKPGGVPRYALGLGNRVVDVGEADDALTRDEARYLDVNDPRQIIADCEADLAILEECAAYFGGEHHELMWHASNLARRVAVDLAKAYGWTPERTEQCPS